MGFDLRQDLRVTQNLVMTPQLQLGVKLLALNNLELVEHLEETLLANPLLERVERREPTAPTEAERVLREVARTSEDRSEQLNGHGEDSYLTRVLREREEYRAPNREGGGTIHEDLPPIETNMRSTTSLAEHLLAQLGMLDVDEVDRPVLEAIAYNLDDRGYLEVTSQEIAQDLQRDLARVEALRLEMMTLDPVGCAAYDLAESLAHQAKMAFPEDDLFPVLISRHFGNLEKRNYAAIARDLELDLEDVVEYHKMLQTLSPHPGSAYSTDSPRYISPDVTVVREDGEWRVVVNDSDIPELRINHAYRKLLERGRQEDRKYLEEQSKSAEFYMQSLFRRKRTIHSVMESILRLQSEYFESGDPEKLRPMVLQDVADDLHAHSLIEHYQASAQRADPYADEPDEPHAIHMSTVSRATSNKYVATPYGIMELKFFFSAKVRQSGGEDVSALAIKTRIRDMIKEEDPTRPWSDQAIADLLKDEGTRVARRTVAKYREALGILPSSTRKQLF